MSRVTPVLLALLSLLTAACTCRGASPADAGTREAKPSAIRHATDLRTALITVYPEFRFSRVTSGRAELRRRMRWEAKATESLEGALEPHLAEKGYQRSDGGEALAVRPPFELFAERSDGEVELTLSLPIGQEEVSKLLQTPSPMTTEVLANYIPALPGAELFEERFVLWLDYETREEWAGQLVWQLVDGLGATEWRVGALPAGYERGRRPDGGFGAVPRELTLELERPHTDSRVRVERRGGHVHLELHQLTFAAGRRTAPGSAE